MAERSGNRRIVFTGLAALALGVAGVAWWTATGSTPEFRDADGRPLPGSIAEERRIELGGVPQYVLLRGRDRNAPLLINVHGGPGMSERAFYRYHNATIEDHFVVARKENAARSGRRWSFDTGYRFRSRGLRTSS
jgi:hypothetical protein